MNINSKKLVKHLKLLGFFVALLLLNGFHSPVQATELEKTSKLYASKLMDSYQSSIVGSYNYWNNNYSNQAQTKFQATQSAAKKNSLAQRMLAVSLGILMEYTSNNTYNELIVQ